MPENDSLPPALAPNESGAMEDSTAHSACVSNPVEIGPAQIAPVSLVIDEENVQGQGTAGQLKSPKVGFVLLPPLNISHSILPLPKMLI